MKRFVIYYRVSTKQQGESGLGLEAQKRDVQIYLDSFVGEGNYEVIGEFEEHKSGKDMASRPALQEALREVRTTENAVLLVSKLDRLSRSRLDIETLLHHGTPFEVATLPNVKPDVLPIYAMIAQSEREFISARTKAALRAKKERGETIDRSNAYKNSKAALSADNGAGYKRASAQSAAKRSELARQHNADILFYIERAKKDGHASYTAIADYLNGLNKRTRRGKPFSVMAVKRIILKAGESEV